MSLLKDMKSKRSQFSSVHEESLLNLIATSEIVNKVADRFLKPYGVTRSQFNILMMLKYEGNKGLKQVEISERMIVTASNVSGQLARLERNKLVTREKADRRTNIVRLTEEAVRLLGKAELVYNKEVKKVMGNLTLKENKMLVQLLDKLRDKVVGRIVK